MSRPRPPGVHREKTRHGKTVWFYRKGHGKRFRLPGPPGCEGFDKALEAAMAGVRTGPKRAQKGSISWLIDEYQLTSEFRDLAPVTQGNRRAIWNKLRTAPIKNCAMKLGEAHPDSITTLLLQKAVDSRTASSALGFMKAMRPLLAWAERLGYIERNPALGVKMPKVKTQGYHIWTAAEVEQFRQHWPLGTRERLLLELTLWTGLRRADVVRLGPQHRRQDEAGELYEIVCGKTRKSSGVTAYIPALPVLDEVLEHYPVRAFAYLTGERGNPMGPKHAGNTFEKACKVAGVPGRLHGLRKSLASLYAEWGLTTSQLNALFGWTTNKQSEVYTRGADRRRLAQDAAKTIKSRTSIPAPPSNSARTL